LRPCYRLCKSHAVLIGLIARREAPPHSVPYSTSHHRQAMRAKNIFIGVLCNIGFTYRTGKTLVFVLRLQLRLHVFQPAEHNNSPTLSAKPKIPSYITHAFLRFHSIVPACSGPLRIFLQGRCDGSVNPSHVAGCIPFQENHIIKSCSHVIRDLPISMS
jgi:hypothetical protein